MNKIKDRFQLEEELYRMFLDILHTYQHGEVSVKEVYKQIADLFKDHADLLDGFADFLPESTPQGDEVEDLNRQVSAFKPFEEG